MPRKPKESAPDAAESPQQNLNGQKMGRKGAETRARLMRAAANLLEKRSIRELQLAEITALAGTSPSSFYVYFDDVPELVLAVAAGVEQITPEIEAILSRPWTSEEAQANGERLIKAYVAFWQIHHAVLRIRNLAADEGDARFEEVRHSSVEKIHSLMEARIADANNGLDASSGASAVLVLIERVAAIACLPLRRRRSSRSELIRSAAFMVAQALSPAQANLAKTPPKTKTRTPSMDTL